MKKLLVTSLLAFAAYGFCQNPPATQPGQTATGQQSNATSQAGAQPQQQQKTIKDPAEYNAYMSAISNTANPQAEAQGLEAFLQTYPNTIVKEEALEQLMGAYSKVDQAKTNDAANRLLQVNPNNLRALAILTFAARAQNNFAQAAQFAQRGLQAPRPEGMSDADWTKMQSGLQVIFNGAIGMNALQQKDYPAAQKALSAAVAVPEDANNLNDVYPLATAYLQANPPDYKNGLFYGAKAVALAQSNPPAQQQIDKFAQYYYKKYHGSLDGWDQYKAAVQSAKSPDEAPAVTPAPPPPTPCEFADTIMKQNPDVSQMAYADWLFVLGSGNQKDADQVWGFLNGKLIPVSSPEHPAKVISATPQELQLATTDDDIQENNGAGKADVTLKMTKPLTAAEVPQPGTNLKGTWLGKATSYTPLPPAQPAGNQAAAAPAQSQNQPAGCLPNTGGGVMLTLTEGSIKGATPAHKAPAKRPAARRRPAAH